MNGSPEESPHFYFDEEAQKWTSIEHSALSKVLVLSWHADPRSMTEQILSKVKALPADIIPVPQGRIRPMLDELASGGIVACVLFLSPAALDDQSLAEFVLICERLFRSKPEFRLFVQLADGLSFEVLKAKAVGGHIAAGALIESVHLSSEDGEDFAHTARLLQSHLLDLPKIRHRLARERWESRWIQVMSVVVGALRWLFAITAVGLVVVGTVRRDDAWGQWLWFGAGQLAYVGLIVLATLGTRIASGSYVRWAFLLGLFLTAHTIPMAGLASQWPFLLAGILTAVVMDVCVRSQARWKRRSVQIDQLLDGSPHRAVCPGHRSLKFLATGPWFPARIRVFVSYSEKSDWGRKAAKDLKDNLKRLNTDCFFAPDSIELGSSWRHRLTSELRDASTFVQFLDANSARLRPDAPANKHWPALELAGASAHQALSGVPAIVVMCRASMMLDAIPLDTHPYIRRVLSTEDAEESSLWTLNYHEETAGNLAQELSRRYRLQAVSILPIRLAAVLDFFLMLPASLLCGVGVFGSVGIWLALIAALAMRMRGASLPDWLLQKGCGQAALMLVAFWLGFVLRLAVAAGLELWHRLSGINFKWRLIEVAALSAVCFRLGRAAHGIAIVYAALGAAFGVMMGSSFVRRMLEGKGWTRS